MKIKITEKDGRYYLYYNYELENKGWLRYSTPFLTEDTALYYAELLKERLDKKYGKPVKSLEL